LKEKTLKFVDVKQYEAIALHKDTIDNLLFKLPGVKAVGIGYKTIGDVETDEMSIIVSVKKKGSFAPAHLIPRVVEGCKTDVIENEALPSPPLYPTEPGMVERMVGENLRRYDPIQPGCSIQVQFPNGDLSRGSLGPKARLLTPDVRDFYLSCWHVLCRTNGWRQEGRDVYQPWENPLKNEDRIGSVIDGAMGLIATPNAALYVDAAYFYVDPRVRRNGEAILSIGPITGWITQENRNTLLNKHVGKYGARTEFTDGGTVTDVHYAWRHPDDPEQTTFLNQFLVRPARPNAIFNETGDSGAPVVTVGNEGRINAGVAIGLVMGKNARDNTCVVNPMWMILRALGLRLAVATPNS
jgi:hypothetical protein